MSFFPTMLRKQVSGPLDSLDPPSWPPRRSRSDNSRKDLVTGPIRGSCALQDGITLHFSGEDVVSGRDRRSLRRINSTKLPTHVRNDIVETNWATTAVVFGGWPDGSNCSRNNASVAIELTVHTMTPATTPSQSTRSSPRLGPSLLRKAPREGARVSPGCIHWSNTSTPRTTSDPTATR